MVLFSCLHAVVALGLLGYATAGSLLRFDGFEALRGSMTAGIAADVLALPGYVLWTTGASKNLPNALEWLLFLANSALWGLVLSATWGLVFASRVRRHRGNE